MYSYQHAKFQNWLVEEDEKKCQERNSGSFGCTRIMGTVKVSNYNFFNIICNTTIWAPHGIKIQLFGKHDITSTTPEGLEKESAVIATYLSILTQYENKRVSIAIFCYLSTTSDSLVITNINNLKKIKLPP